MTYPQPPGYPPAPQYPQQPGYPPPQSYPPSYPQQQPAGYAPPAPPAPAQNFEIDDFYDQPAASGKSIAGWFQVPGQSISGIVARAISKADIRAQTDMQTKQPKYYSDRRPMTTMTIPLLVQPSPDFPDGRAAFIVSASDREDLDLAMQAAGCAPRTVPEAGAVITVTFTGLKQIPGFGSAKKVKKITYQRPPGAVNEQAVPPTAEAVLTPGAPAPAGYQQVAPHTQYAPAQPPTWDPSTSALPPGTSSQQPQFQTVTPEQAYAQQPPFQPPFVPPTPAQPAAPAGFPSAAVPPGAAPSPSSYAVPGDLTPEQAERLRQLTGGQ